jgi:hypothetical protein
MVFEPNFNLPSAPNKIIIDNIVKYYKDVDALWDRKRVDERQ